MRYLQVTAEGLQITLGGIICLYSVWAQFAQAGVRKRHRTSFIYVLIAILLTLLAEQGVLVVSTKGMPDLPPLVATILYILPLVLQIDRLYPCTAEEKNREPAWHMYFRSWSAMFLFDLVAIIKLILTTRSLTGMTATSLRICMELVLVALSTRPDRGGYIRLPDDIENATMGTDDNDQRGESSEPSALGRSVSDEIEAAGGLLPWLKDFQVFLPWIWPSGEPWIKLCILGSLALLLASTALTILLPRLYSSYIERLAQAFASGTFDIVSHTLIFTKLAGLLGIALSYGHHVLWKKYEIRRDILVKSSIQKHVMHNDATFHAATNSTDINTAADDGIIICATLDFLLLEAMPQMITLALVSTTTVLLYGPYVALVQVSVLALDTIIVLRSNRKTVPILDAQTFAHQEARRRREGALRAWMTVTLCGQVEQEIDAYNTLLHTETALEWRGYINSVGYQFGSHVVLEAGTLCATAFAIQYGIQTGNNFGSVVMFGNYWALMKQPLQFFTRIPKRLSRDLYTADRLRRIVTARSKMQYGSADLKLTGGGIKLKNVSFSYSNDSGEVKPLFKGLTLEIAPRQTVAFVGPSGVGKSTLFDLITRQFDPDEGSVEVDGQDIRTLPKGMLPQYMSTMNQSPHIFDTTVKSNIAYRSQEVATEAEVHDAARMAGAHDDIMTWENTYGKAVGENGSKLSGGQNQRLALARTFLGDAPIMLIDEGTSALDGNTEAKVKESVKNRDKTTILIAHRLSSTTYADRIIVFGKDKDGCSVIVEEGKHWELLARDGVYAQLWKDGAGEVSSTAAATRRNSF